MGLGDRVQDTEDHFGETDVSKDDPMLAHLKRGGIVCFAPAKDSPTRCLRRTVKAATSYWPMVTCRKCQSMRTAAEGKVSQKMQSEKGK